MPKPSKIQALRYLLDILTFFILLIGFVLQMFTGLVNTQTFIAAAVFVAAMWSLDAKWEE